MNLLPRRCFACLLLIATCLLGCAAPPAPAPPATPVAEAPTATVAPASPTARPPTPTPLPPTPTPAPEPLRLWVAEEGAALAAVEALAGEYAAAAGIPVQVVARPADALRLSLATAELTGDPPPDLIWGDANALAGLMADGRLQPIGPASAAPAALPALITSATADGQFWGWPVAARGALLLLYNRAIVAEPPTTSDELILRSRASETALVAGLVQAWDEAAWLAPWLYAFGGALTSADGASITLNTPAMEQALNLMRELYVAAPDDGDSYRRGQRLFAQGYAAILLDGDWALEQYRAVSDTLDLGIAPLPVVPATGRPAAPLLGGDFLMLHRDLSGERLEQARELMAYLGAPERQADLAAAFGRLPADPEALAGLDPAADPALAAVAVLAARSPGLPPTPAARCAVRGVDVWLRSLLTGVTDAAETATRMQREAEACLAG